jgi:hypothetical protein
MYWEDRSKVMEIAADMRFAHRVVDASQAGQRRQLADKIHSDKVTIRKNWIKCTIPRFSHSLHALPKHRLPRVRMNP